MELNIPAVALSPPAGICTESLEIQNDTVLWLRNSVLFQKFRYPGQTVTRALFAEFGLQEKKTNGSHLPSGSPKSVVVLLADMAYIYAVNGLDYQINLPFTVKRAESYGSGVILERAVDPRDREAPLPKFFTLADPVLGLGITASSAVSAISSEEELLFVGNCLHSSIYLTNDPAKGMVNFYHARYLSKGNKILRSSTNTRRQSSSRRKSSIMSRPAVEDTVADDSVDKDMFGSMRTSIPHTMDRTSDLGTSEGPDNSSNSSPNLTLLRKDVILTFLAKFNVSAATSELKVLAVSDNEKEVLAVLDLRTHRGALHTFAKPANPSGLPTLKMSEWFDTKDMTLIHGNIFLMLSEQGQLTLLHPLLNIRSPAVRMPPISSILSCSGNTVTLLTTTNDQVTLQLKLAPTSELVAKCFNSLELLLDPLSSQYLQFVWASALFLHDSDSEWIPFVATVLSILLDFNDRHYSTATAASATDHNQALEIAREIAQSQFGSHSDFSDIKEYTIYCLHLVREDFKLRVNCREHVTKLGILLSWLVQQAGWTDNWMSYYETEVVHIEGPKMHCPQPIPAPSNILQTLFSHFQPPFVPFVTMSDLGHTLPEQESHIFANIYTTLELFGTINNPSVTFDDISELLTKLGVSGKYLDLYPEGVRLPLLEIVDYIKANSHIEGDVPMVSSNKRVEDSSTAANPKDIRSLLQSIGDDTANLWDGQSESDRISISRLIFSADRRFYEVSRLLQSSRIQSATLIQSPEWNEHECMIMQQELFRATAIRTLSISFGRAALLFSARRPLMTEKYPIPKINFDVTIKPSNVTVSIQRPVLSDESISWGYFHGGVSAGLSVSKDSTHVNGSWVIFNKTTTLSSQYAGFLLGLGLNGLLKDLEEYHIYNLLRPKHPHTSIALLIGMAASHLGTMNTKLTKVLSVHVIALLPVGASDLHIPPLVQCAGVIGTGLLYCNTAHRRMSEILLGEILGSRKELIESENDESYRLAAGISYGLINLGRGNEFTSLIDSESVDRLVRLTTYATDIQESTRSNKDRAVCGAIMALMFTFLKTNNKGLASKLAIPNSIEQLKYFRPDILYLRTLASCLIKWNDIGNSREWVESRVPSVLFANGKIDQMRILDSDQMIYLNVIAALCSSVGYKYASTADESAKKCILYYLDHFIRLAELPVGNYDEIMTRTSLNNNIGSLSFALATVMVGTGDLDSLRRLRRLYGRTKKDTTFGSQMANQLSLGILFLGGGQYAFSNSNIAIAGLVVAFYPLLPSRLRDNISHLQVLRHFWCFACEPRCLIVRDQSNNGVVEVEVKLTLKSGVVVDQKAPCLLHDVEEIANVSINDPKYFPVKLDLFDEEEDDTPAIQLFKKKKIIYVNQKVADIMRADHLFDLALDTIEKQHSAGEKGLFKRFKNVRSFANLDRLRLRSLQSISGSYAESLTASAIDIIMTLERMACEPSSIDDLWNLRLVFAFADKWKASSDMKYVPRASIERLRSLVWLSRATLK